MLCPKCGAPNADEARVCDLCGEPIVWAAPPAQPVQAAQPVQPVTCGWAIAALVLGLLALPTCMLTAPLAVVAGIVAAIKISGSAGRLKGMGMAIAGICMPAVAVPIMAVLAGIFIPSLSRVREQAHQVACRSNLRQLSLAMRMYADENDGVFPTPSNWCDLLTPYVNDRALFQCPTAEGGRCTYAMNKHLEGLGPDGSADLVLLFETQPGWNQAGDADALTTEHHNDWGCNVAFADTHVEFVSPRGLYDLRWTPQSLEPGDESTGALITQY